MCDRKQPNLEQRGVDGRRRVPRTPPRKRGQQPSRGDPAANDVRVGPVTLRALHHHERNRRDLSREQDRAPPVGTYRAVRVVPLVQHPAGPDDGDDANRDVGQGDQAPAAGPN